MGYVTDNKLLGRARETKNDEYYTRVQDIDKEIQYYKPHLKGKVVYCNCDTQGSGFVRYFVDNFHVLGLKKLMFTYYNKAGSVVTTYNGKVFVYRDLVGDGSFDSDECVSLLEQADVVVTNPPFSLFKEFMALLVSSGKGFIVVGGINAVSYKDMFSWIVDKKVWLGVNILRYFMKPDGSIGQVKTYWYTNLEHGVVNDKLVLNACYDEGFYSRYCNYDAIEVGRIGDIPCDYYGEMGVPKNYMEKHDPSRFEIVSKSSDKVAVFEDVYVVRDYKVTSKRKRRGKGLWLLVDGPVEHGLYQKGTGKWYKEVFERIIIRRVGK